MFQTVLKPRSLLVAPILLLLAAAPFATNATAEAENAQVLVTVNDVPITTYDVRQRIALWKLVGGKPADGDLKKRALDELIDDIAEIQEASRLGFGATEVEIDKRVASVAENLKTDSAGLKAKLKSQGVALAALRQYISAQFAFHRLVRASGGKDLSVSEAEVRKKTAEYRAKIDANIDKQIAKLENDPRRKAVTVYQIMEIGFPVEAAEGEAAPQVLQSRALEVNQFLGRFSGCKSVKQAAAGIFNVKIGKVIEADASKIPKQLRQALDTVKVGKALGPIRSSHGLQALAFCGVRTATPPRIQRPTDIQYPTPAQVRSAIEQEKFAAIEEKFRGTWRKNLLIEYRDHTLNQ